MIKAIFLDFDGTLYSHSTKQIPPLAIEGLNLAKKNGIKLFLCTGRAKSELRYFDFSKLKLDGIIACNGQVIFDDKDQIIYDNPVKGILKDNLVELYKDKVFPVYLCLANKLILSFSTPRIEEAQKAIGSRMPSIEEYNNQDFYMGCVMLNDNSDSSIFDSLKEYADITYWAGAGAVDVVPKNVSKAKGIDETIKYFNIDISETMSFGDGHNDIDMLKHTNIGIAMGNSNEEVKQIADYVTEDADHNGIYNALKHYELV